MNQLNIYDLITPAKVGRIRAIRRDAPLGSKHKVVRTTTDPANSKVMYETYRSGIGNEKGEINE